jgi:hypothetical protein
MRRLPLSLCLVAVVALAVVAPATAQDKPKGDIAISYSVLYDKELPSDVLGINGWLPYGWVLSASGRVTDSFSVVGEAGGNYKKIQSGYNMTLGVHSFLGGVRYSARDYGKAVPFVQLLFGAARASASSGGVSAGVTGFAAQWGTGVDIAATKRLAVRIQGDYRFLRAGGGNGNEFRLATGIVYNF